MVLARHAFWQMLMRWGIQHVLPAQVRFLVLQYAPVQELAMHLEVAMSQQHMAAVCRAVCLQLCEGRTCVCIKLSKATNHLMPQRNRISRLSSHLVPLGLCQYHNDLEITHTISAPSVTVTDVAFLTIYAADW